MMHWQVVQAPPLPQAAAGPASITFAIRIFSLHTHRVCRPFCSWLVKLFHVMRRIAPKDAPPPFERLVWAGAPADSAMRAMSLTLISAVCVWL